MLLPYRQSNILFFDKELPYTLIQVELIKNKSLFFFFWFFFRYISKIKMGFSEFISKKLLLLVKSIGTRHFAPKKLGKVSFIYIEKRQKRCNKIYILMIYF